MHDTDTVHRTGPRLVALCTVVLVTAIGLAAGLYPAGQATAAPIRQISIDGSFGDWTAVPSYSDPVDDQHDTDPRGQLDTPSYVNHPDVDILEYKFAHDEENLYAYFRATGEIGATQSAAAGRAGRYYVIVTIDVDNDDITGYWLNEGGYYPTSTGYDANMEVEFYNDAFNTGHYINHGALNQAELNQATVDQINGVVDVLPGSYDYYTQWVWFDDPNQGQYQLPAPDDGASIEFVEDRGPVYQGIVEIALSPDGHEAEMVAPFRGFMRDKGSGNPSMALGKTIDISFSLEASGELAPSGDWASDTAAPIVGYVLDSLVLADMDIDGDVDFDDIDDFVTGLNSAAVYEAAHGVPPVVHGDMDQDTDFDFDDIAGFVASLNTPLGSGPQSVPEPSALALLAIALSCLAVRARR